MTGPQVFSIRMPLSIGLVAITLLLGGVGFWSVRTEIAGAIVANGTVVVKHNRQVIQHAEGGIVDLIAARDGDLVRAGDILVELDDSLLRTELAVAELQLIELRARRARLAAERDNAADIKFPETLLGLTSEDAQEQIKGQRTLFAARRTTLEQELRQISERILQTKNQIAGTEAQLAALVLQERLTREDLEVQESALQRGLTQLGRVSQLRRDAARLQGDAGKLTSEIARFKGEIAGFELESVRIRNERRETAISEIRDITYRELELVRRRESLLKRIERLSIRAPVNGVVYGSTIFARHAVVQPAEALMFIVPGDQPLIISSRVEAVDIDQVHLGQIAELRFSAFNQRITPDVSSRVIFVSADILQDDLTGMAYYRVDLLPEPEDLAGLDDKVLLPGMPVEAFLRTDNRTPLSYLMKPLTDYFGRAFRES